MCRRRKRSLVVGEFAAERSILLRRDNHGDILEVLSGGSDHGWAADIDVFDQFFTSDIASRSVFFESIEIHHDHVERRDLVVGKGLHVPPVSTNSQNAACDARVNCFYAPVKHLGETR